MSDRLFCIKYDALRTFLVLKRTEKQIKIKDERHGWTHTVRVAAIGEDYFDSEFAAWSHEEQRIKDRIEDFKRSIQGLRSALGTAEKMRAKAARDSSTRPTSEAANAVAGLVD